MFQSLNPVYRIASGSNVDVDVEYRFNLGRDKLKGTAMIIDNEYECRYACERIKEYCSQCRVVGFDAEWLPEYYKGIRNRVALVQIATPQKGDVFLFRLNILSYMPDSLRAILEDRSIVKVGVSPKNDCDNIEMDYGVLVCGTLDLRLLYNTLKGLASLAKDVLNVEVIKGFVTVSNWESEELSLDQIRYAASDAFASVEIFKKWAGITFDGFGRPNKLWNEVHGKIFKYLDVPFRKVDQVIPYFEKPRTMDYNRPQIAASECASAKGKKIYSSSVNAPDDTFLWNASKMDAETLVRQGKGEVVSYTIRLFEDLQNPPPGDAGLPKSSVPLIQKVVSGKPLVPSAMAPSTSGIRDLVKQAESLTLKGGNVERCVVCGSVENLGKKYIVPKTYLAYFPQKLAEKCRVRDVLPMCASCEKKSMVYIQILTDYLKYAAGLDCPNSVVNIEREMVNLLIYNQRVPNTVTSNFLRESMNWETDKRMCARKPLGEVVVKVYEMNHVCLTKLRKLWCEMFVEAMAPRFLPKNWSVDCTEVCDIHKNCADSV